MVILFLGIVLGFIARKASVMNDRFDGQFSKLVLNVTLPCLIISSVLMNDELPDASTVGLIFLLSCASYAIILAIAFAVPFLLRFPKDKRGTYSFMIAFGNVGFIGFPGCPPFSAIRRSFTPPYSTSRSTCSFSP